MHSSRIGVGTRRRVGLFVDFMGYCLMAALRKHLGPAVPGLSPKAVLEQLGGIKMVDVCLPTSDSAGWIMLRYTEPEPQQLMLLEKLGLSLPGPAAAENPRRKAANARVQRPARDGIKTHPLVVETYARLSAIAS